MDGTARWKRVAKPAAVLLIAACLALMALPVGLAPRQAVASGGTITFHGHGKGHGVGMCMAGVYFRALRGETYRDIIQTYYTGVDFSTIDDNMVISVKCRDGVVRYYTMADYCWHQQEEPNSWPIEGMKVTITAFRTYAYATKMRGKHAADGYDICSSGSCCQAMNEAIPAVTSPTWWPRSTRPPARSSPTAARPSWPPTAPTAAVSPPPPKRSGAAPATPTGRRSTTTPAPKPPPTTGRSP